MCHRYEAIFSRFIINARTARTAARPLPGQGPVRRAVTCRVRRWSRPDTNNPAKDPVCGDTLGPLLADSALHDHLCSGQLPLTRSQTAALTQRRTADPGTVSPAVRDRHTLGAAPSYRRSAPGAPFQPADLSAAPPCPAAPGESQLRHHRATRSQNGSPGGVLQNKTPEFASLSDLRLILEMKVNQ